MRFVTVSPVLLILATTVGCDVTITGESDEVRQIGDFVSVTNQSDADVVLVDDSSGLSPGEIRVVCEGEIVADVDTSVDSSGNLVIKFAAEVASVFGCEIHVPADGIEVIVDDGDGNVVCDDTLRDVRSIEVNGNGSVDLASVEADELDILVTGTGELNIDSVVVETIRIDLRGAGDATLGGEAVYADLKISGNGDLRAKELTVSDTLDALLNGTGNAEITVLGTVNAEVHGDASLVVYGGAEAGEILEVDGGEVIFE